MILILPFMQMQSGHHQVADAIAAHIKKQDPAQEVEKLDIFNYTFPRIEKMISRIYLAWIQKHPVSYSKFYAKQFNQQTYDFKPFSPWENLMEQTLERIILEKKPEAVICTHSFPSHAVGNLKVKGHISVPVINAYTDFFAGGVWAKAGIDLHLVPSKAVGEQLKTNFDIASERILISGIPVHPSMTRIAQRKHSPSKHLLLAGGNSGLGDMASLTEQCRAYPDTQFSVLCGNNKQLYEKIKASALPNVTPLSYISSREDMNALYEQVDGLITKPGGVTISEAFVKRVPIFVSSVLPGQEQINMDYLVPKQLVYALDSSKPAIAQVMTVLEDQLQYARFERAIAQYEQDIELNTERFIEQVLHILPYDHIQPRKRFNKMALLS
ncbi:MGDG synthase family glycosyltransferase [Kurthia huakuii]|uniref:MGDG synthase family glycosyltransferase n=1 Tax=Kurthia huakuii TaxID=1421019 RepID=UPI0004B2D26D|nr:hypothetical protein [Kurthia huakuii]MBM7698775.1 UDP-N-acetylglucosamine:LPS N-acetylglucosamine transferase [Kurthia huakuii]